MRPLITLKRQGLSFFCPQKVQLPFFLCFCHSILLKAKKKPLARPGRERAVDTDAVGGRWSSGLASGLPLVLNGELHPSFGGYCSLLTPPPQHYVGLPGRRTDTWTISTQRMFSILRPRRSSAPSRKRQISQVPPRSADPLWAGALLSDPPGGGEGWRERETEGETEREAGRRRVDCGRRPWDARTCAFSPRFTHLTFRLRRARPAVLK